MFKSRSIFFFIFLLISVLLIFFQKKMVYDAPNFDFLWKNISSHFKNNYINYFFKKDNNPTYVWKSDMIDEYIEYCHYEGKNCLIIPHQQTYASLIWINSIQYVWTLFLSEALRYLYPLLDNVTNISPYWDYPYTFWQLILPIDKTAFWVAYEDIYSSWLNTVELGNKWIMFNCDAFKLNIINSLDFQEYYEIYLEKWDYYNKLINPCSSYWIPYHLAFNYFYYLSDWENSARNYTLTSFIEWAPSASSSMVSVVMWRYWEHLKSMQLWLSQYFSHYESYINAVSDDEINFLEWQMKESVNKAIFELQLHILSSMTSNFSDTWECFHDYECLLNSWYLAFAVQDLIWMCMEWYDPNSLIDWSWEFAINSICFTLEKAITSDYILLDWNLFYPFEDNFIFYWDDERFNSWWIKQW